MLATYGNLNTKVFCARCSKCGRYRIETELWYDIRGAPRCIFCGCQVKLKPQPSRMNHNTKRRKEMENLK